MLIAWQRILFIISQKSLKKLKELDYFLGGREGEKKEDKKELNSFVDISSHKTNQFFPAIEKLNIPKTF